MLEAPFFVAGSGFQYYSSILVEAEYIPRVEKYERYEDALGQRNCCSKTDKDATCMQMKEDHMHNRSLKPGYNVQIGTENQMIVGFSFHQTSTDSPTLIPHLQQLKKNLGKLPPTWIADAGYGGEENYLALLAEQIMPYIKYSFFEKDRKKRRKISEKKSAT